MIELQEAYVKYQKLTIELMELAEAAKPEKAEDYIIKQKAAPPYKRIDSLNRTLFLYIDEKCRKLEEIKADLEKLV